MNRIISILCVLFFAICVNSQEPIKKESPLQQAYPKTIKKIVDFNYPHFNDPGELEKGSKAEIMGIAKILNVAEKNLSNGDKKEVEAWLSLISTRAQIIQMLARFDERERKDDPKKKSPSCFYRISWNGSQWVVSTLKTESQKK